MFSPQPFWLKFTSVLQFAMSGEAPPPHRLFLVPAKFLAHRPRVVPPRVRPKVVPFRLRPAAPLLEEARTEEERIAEETGAAVIIDEEKRIEEETRAAVILAQEKKIAEIKRVLAEREQKEKAMHSNIASAAAKPAALPASADSQAEAERVFEDLQHLFETHADFAAAVRECKRKQPQSGEAEPSHTPGDVQGSGVGIRTAGCDDERRSKRKQRKSGEAEPSHAPGDVQGTGVGVRTARCNDELRGALEKQSTDDELPNVEVQVTGCHLVDKVRVY